MTRASDWYSRIYFPANATMRLGGGYETWILDPERYEGSEALRATLRTPTTPGTLKRSSTKRDLAYELVDNLLGEVLAAAGGVEQSIMSLRSSIAEAQAYADQHVKKPIPGVPHGIGHPSIPKAWYDFANLLSWARVLEERLDRRPAQRRLRPGAPLLPNQGLVNAVKPVRLKNRVDRLLSDLRAGPVGEARLLANFTLHSALVRDPNSGAWLGPGGKVIMPIPDKSAAPIAHRKTLTWNDGRDALAFAEELWASVDDFMEHLIEAFERATPRRFRKVNLGGGGRPARAPSMPIAPRARPRLRGIPSVPPVTGGP
jgi:hypothetical protein